MLQDLQDLKSVFKIKRLLQSVVTNLNLVILLLDLKLVVVHGPIWFIQLQ